MSHKPQPSPGERGSALLIVFVFAAILAITLFTQLPIVAFEAKRQKEQLLIDRGEEYAHAVKLYRRKLNQYPGNLDALENTNRMRFLRKRFKDPFTDKAEWRFLHAGPNGVITDSKVKRTTSIAGAGIGVNPISTFGGANTNPTTNAPNTTAPTAPVGGGTDAVRGLLTNPNPTTPNSAFNTSSGAKNSQFGGRSFGDSSATGGTSFGNTSSTTTQNNQIQSGGIAGVASKVERHSIKTVDDQQDYSLWEFYYDPSKDPAINAAGAALSPSGAVNNGNIGPGNRPPAGPTSSFGNFGSGLSGMGGNQPGTPSQRPAPQATVPPQQ